MLQLFEGIGKIIRGAEAYRLGDFRYGFVRVVQLPFGHLDPRLVDVMGGAHVHMRLKEAAQMLGRDVGEGGQRVQGEIVEIILFNIAFGKKESRICGLLFFFCLPPLMMGVEIHEITVYVR